MSYRNRRTPRPPYFTTARFDSICPDSGQQIKKGDEILYYPSLKKAYHTDSDTAADFRGQQFNEGFNMPDANY